MTSAAYFSEVAPEWDAIRQEFYSDEVRSAAIQAAKITSQDIFSTAVDVGAGAGFITSGLTALGLSVVAVDPVPEMLDVLLKQPFAARDVVGRVGSAESLPLEDGEAAFAFSNMCLHHVEHPGQAIREMFRVVRPGGRVVITDLERHEVERLKKEHHDVWLGFKHECIQHWLTEAGFQEIEVGTIGVCCGSGTGCSVTVDGEGIGVFLATATKPRGAGAGAKRSEEPS